MSSDEANSIEITLTLPRGAVIGLFCDVKKEVKHYESLLAMDFHAQDSIVWKPETRQSLISELEQSKATLYALANALEWTV